MLLIETALQALQAKRCFVVERAAGFRQHQARLIGLTRCLKGAMVHGLTHGAFLDERQFWPILDTAQRLDVPIYLHDEVPYGRV